MDDHEAKMQAALAECDNSNPPVYAHIAEKHKVNRTTLSKRYHGMTVSREEAAATHHQHLSIAQEHALIDWINRLSN
jgi:hypothetical protein